MSLSGSTTFSICFAVGAGRTSIGSNRKRSQALKTRKGHKRNTDKTLLSSAGVPMTWTSLPLRDTETLAFEPVPTRSVKPLPQFTHEGFIKKKDFKRRDTVEGEEAVPDNEDVAGFEYSSEDEDNLSETKGLEETPTNLANEDEGRAISEKGVPAIMRCFDTAKIYVKAGDGGNGVVAFRREKYVPLGGPCGGNGGRGGDIFVEVDSSMNSLLPFRKCLHFRAENGSHGRGRCQDGAKGDDVVVRVPPGTVVRDASDGTLLMELTAAGQRAKILSGGRGGRGNASFKNVNNKAPQIAENGEEGSEMWLDLELKLVADVGIIGAPNAGKSTLLSSISAAKPNIADYPFTTLLPNLGVVALDCHSTMVVADLPGLLEGAHRGYGLGHEFLRHIERCHVLIHVIDGSSCQPEYEFDAVRLELDLFSPEIAQKPFLVAFNKIDIPEAADRWNTFNEKFKQHGIQPFCMSAAARVGTMDVVHAAYELLQKKRASFHHAQVDVDQFKDVASMLRKNQNSRLDEFEISFDKKAKAWIVHGSPLERFIQMTNWEYFESFKRFQRVLEACGVDRALRQCGIKEGDTVFVGEMELEWHDSTDFSEVLDRPRYSRGSRKWPH